MNSRENKLLNYDTLHTVLQSFFFLSLFLLIIHALISMTMDSSLMQTKR